MLFRALSCLLLCYASTGLKGAEPAFPVSAKKILFLGDSVTYGGKYPAYVETQLRLAGLAPVPEIISLGLSSETVTGLTEPTHPFPRPNVHERLNRALKQIQPDVVVACYGVNDGIYAPFQDERFQAYQSGITQLIGIVHQSGAKLVLMTPPPFDPLPLRKAGKLQPANADQFDWNRIFERYDEEVLQPYARWVLKQAPPAEMAIDLHTAVSEAVREKRKTNPDFTLSGDGIHLNDEGNRIIAATILQAWKVPVDQKPAPNVEELIIKKQNLMKHAWLSKIGHLRPGIQEGVPMDQATEEAKRIDDEIQKLLNAR